MTDKITGMNSARPDDDWPKVQGLTMTDRLLGAFGRQLTLSIIRGCHGDFVGSRSCEWRHTHLHRAAIDEQRDKHGYRNLVTYTRLQYSAVVCDLVRHCHALQCQAPSYLYSSFLSRLSFAVEPLGVLFLFVSACRCINIVEHKVTWKCRFVACCPVAELLPVRLSGNMLVSINIATRRQVRLVPEWVTDWLSQDG